MSESLINELLKVTLDSMREIVDVNITMGDVFDLGDARVIPISRVKYSFISGGIDQKKGTGDHYRNPFGGAAGGNVSVTPIAFLACCAGEVKVLHLDEKSHTLEQLIDLIPIVIEKVKEMFKKNNISNDTTVPEVVG